MKIEKKLAGLAEGLLAQLDNLGYKLDEIGVENQINRHNLIALVMAGQKRFEGEMDSLGAKFDTGKSKVEGIAVTAEQYIESGINLALFPAKYAYDRIKSQL